MGRDGRAFAIWDQWSDTGSDYSVQTLRRQRGAKRPWQSECSTVAPLSPTRELELNRLRELLTEALRP